MGNTRVICGVMIEEGVPRWMKEQGVTGGWLTAEYSMLPYSTHTRKPRDITKGRLDGRSTEIQRLDRAIAASGGRSGKTRAAHDVGRLRCAPGRWRNAHGGDHRREPGGGASPAGNWSRRRKSSAAHPANWSRRSAPGCLNGVPLLDLNYEEDKAVTVDFNLVATEDGEFVEVQGSGEEATFSARAIE